MGCWVQGFGFGAYNNNNTNKFILIITIKKNNKKKKAMPGSASVADPCSCLTGGSSSTDAFLEFRVYSNAASKRVQACCASPRIQHSLCCLKPEASCLKRPASAGQPQLGPSAAQVAQVPASMILIAAVTPKPEAFYKPKIPNRMSKHSEALGLECPKP